MKNIYYYFCALICLGLKLSAQTTITKDCFGNGTHYMTFDKNERMWLKSSLQKNELVYNWILDRGEDYSKSDKIIWIVRGESKIYGFKDAILTESQLVDVWENGPQICLIVHCYDGYRYILLKKSDLSYQLIDVYQFITDLRSIPEGYKKFQISGKGIVNYENNGDSVQLRVTADVVLKNGVSIKRQQNIDLKRIQKPRD